jgi:AcrR family transcriptional regulator
MAAKKGSRRKAPTVRRVKRAEVRRRILEAAGRLFIERGLEATSLEAVAEEAGFSKGAVYSNFDGKDGLCFELLSAGIDRRIAEVEKAMAAARGADRRAGSAGERLLSLVESEPGWQVFFVELWLRCVRSHTLGPRFAEKRRRMRGQIAGMLEAQAAAAGLALPLPSQQMAASILALSNGLGMEGLIDREAVPPDLMGRLLDWTLKGMMTDGGGAA